MTAEDKDVSYIINAEQWSDNKLRSLLHSIDEQTQFYSSEILILAEQNLEITSFKNLKSIQFIPTKTHDSVTLLNATALKSQGKYLVFVDNHYILPGDWAFEKLKPIIEDGYLACYDGGSVQFSNPVIYLRKAFLNVAGFDSDFVDLKHLDLIHKILLRFGKKKVLIELARTHKNLCFKDMIGLSLEYELFTFKWKIKVDKMRLHPIPALFGSILGRLIILLTPSHKLFKNYLYSQDWTTFHTENWIDILDQELKSTAIHYLEIGCYEGRTLIWMLDNVITHPKSKALAIDLFEDPIIYHRYKLNLKKSRHGKKVKTIKGRSATIISQLEEHSLDLIYVDGSHLVEDVLLDALLSWRLIRDGGTIIFDDYHLGENQIPEKIRPKHGLDYFLSLHKDEIRIIHAGHQLIIKKDSSQNKSIDDHDNFRTAIGDYHYYWNLYQKDTMKTGLFHRQGKKVPLTHSQDIYIKKIISLQDRTNLSTPAWLFYPVDKLIDFLKERDRH